MRELEKRTGVHREAIRSYIRHGLLPEPERPSRNQAHYGEHHVEAITLVQKLRLDTRLTLPELREVMQGRPSTVQLNANAFGQLEKLLASRVGIDAHLVEISSLIDRSPGAVSDAEVLARQGIIQITVKEGESWVALTDAQLILLWGEMRSVGFNENLNFGPHLTNVYLQAAELVAAWEAETFIIRTEGKINIDEAASMLQSGMPLMLNFMGLLRTKAFMRNIEAHQSNLNRMTKNGEKKRDTADFE